MKIISKWPFFKSEPSSIDELRDMSPLDREFLNWLKEHQKVATSAEFMKAFDGRPRYGNSLPLWLATAQHKGWLKRDPGDHSVSWILTSSGEERLEEIE